MSVHFAPPRAAARIHPQDCECQACRDAYRALERRISRAGRIMFWVAAPFVAALGILVTPQQIVAAVAAAL